MIGLCLSRSADRLSLARSKLVPDALKSDKQEAKDDTKGALDTWVVADVAMNGIEAYLLL